MAIKQDIRLAVDAVIFSFAANIKKVLLVQRKNDPFKGQWVFPGGFVDDGENLETAAIRELEEETSLRMENLSQLKAYGDPGRDPRGHTVTVAFIGQVNADAVKTKAASDAEAAKWFDLNDLPQLGFDHSEILKDAIKFFKK
ncbi:NUDIX hydrolase [Cryomorpha ignava]|uniref:NUDIX hydrolase n=1 Tax=Cryomorpha ignava TaxID=101383 RepID=A0A7K3WN04_9FLAO|nr:NUDIX hydrolase [Cryomorpha ignava]NEN22252.1 NUDIX hydrolase [Cryomorpha ignava]